MSAGAVKSLAAARPSMQLQCHACSISVGTAIELLTVSLLLVATNGTYFSFGVCKQRPDATACGPKPASPDLATFLKLLMMRPEAT